MIWFIAMFVGILLALYSYNMWNAYFLCKMADCIMQCIHRTEILQLINNKKSRLKTGITTISISVLMVSTEFSPSRFTYFSIVLFIFVSSIDFFCSFKLMQSHLNSILMQRDFILKLAVMSSKKKPLLQVQEL